MSSPGTGAGAPTEIDPALRRIAAVVVLGIIMSILDTTIVIVAIDTLGREFNTTLSSIQWVSTGYLLALSTVIPLSGWAVERFGAKRMWMISLTLFVLGSVLCGMAWSAPSLIVFRVLQGFGGGMIMPIGMSILAREAGPARMGRVMSIVGVPALLAPVLGPVIGGVLVDNLSWRWIFYVNVPVGIVALVLAARLLPAGEKLVESKLDVVGLALVSPGLAAVVYGLSEAGSSGSLTSPKVVVGLVVGVLLIAAFTIHALRSDNPLMDLRLYRNRTFTVASLTSFVVGAVLFGAMFILPLYYQVVRGSSALEAGLLLAPQGLGAMIAMPIGGRIVDRAGAGRVVPFGVLAVAAGTVAYTQVSATTPIALLAASLFVRGIGMGFVMMPAMAAAYTHLSRAEVPRATTMVNIVQRVGGSLGTALFAVVLERHIAASVPGGGGGGLNSTGGSVAGTPFAGVIADAFGSTFWVIVGSTLLAVIPAILLPRQGVAAQLAAQPTPAAQPEIATEVESAAAGERSDGTTMAGATKRQ
ncbi:MAG TPA: DHA2 family efflux MFS transporter permease subunit [Frankiaceae bacterium]|nr:DHA2 family efflux MFS transporter permease subunit [Frankiaceae bacterium]